MHLEDAEVAEMGSVLQLLLRSQALWTSPQCRAVQTAMVALQPLACGGALAVELKVGSNYTILHYKVSSISLMV